MIAYRKAVALNSDLFEPQVNLGVALRSTGRFDEAIAALGRAVALKPTRASSHYDLGRALAGAELFSEAAAAYQRATELDPDYAEAWCQLGDVLRRQGQFAEALSALERGHELGSKRNDWPYPSARWVEQCQLAGELAPRLSALLRGEFEPVGAAERCAYALLWHDQKLYAACARLYREALTADPHLADDLQAGCRFEAACAAAQAGCGGALGVDQLDDHQRASWRQQAVQWLRADLEAYTNRLVDEKPDERRFVRQRLSGWRGHADLAGLRETDQIAKLPLEEQQACKQLWADVQTVLSGTDSAH